MLMIGKLHIPKGPFRAARFFVGVGVGVGVGVTSSSSSGVRGRICCVTQGSPKYGD